MNTVPPPLPPPLPPQGPPPLIATQPAPSARQKRKTPVLLFVLGGLLLLVVLIGGIAIGAYFTTRSSGDPMKVAARRDPELESTLRSMQVAATMGDWQAFSRHVDVSALKSSIRQISRESFAEGRKKGEMDGVESFLAELLVGVVLDKYVTEENLPQIMSYFTLAIALTDDGKQQPDPDVRHYAYFAGSEVFVMAGENTKKKEGGYLVFRKDRLAGWRLAGLTDKKP